MKTLKYGILFLLFAVVLSGCASPKKEEKKETVDYIIGVEGDNAPYYSADKQGNAEGIYVELMNILSEAKNFSYRFQEMTISDFQADSSETVCDMYLGAVVQETGEQTYVQTEPIWQTKLSLLVRKGSGIKKVEGLQDTSIAARAGTGEEKFADYLAAQYYGNSILFRDIKNVISDFEAGYSKALVIDEKNISAKMQENTQWKLMKNSGKYFNSHCFTAYQKQGIPEEIISGIRAAREEGTLDSLLSVYS